jgi:galactokinase/mevalonate kinase-like predicted kinase
MTELVRIITAADPAERDRSLDSFCRPAKAEQLLEECAGLEQFRRSSDNLYERVRALFFLYGIHRFHLPLHAGPSGAQIPFEGYESLLKRRFEEAIRVFLDVQARQGASDGISSALAAAYRGLAFQTLADQVRRSVRSVQGNRWMFRTGHPADYPLRLRHELLARGEANMYPILREATPVRMDLTHSGWSDIFFLGMDFPEGARVLNVSIDLSVRGDGGGSPRPPVEASFRVIDQPVIRLVSVDLKAVAEATSLEEIFDFARDYLGLLKAAIIASGIVPPGMEGTGRPLSELLAKLLGAPGLGFELVSQVNDIPKGSRLAVSTSLLACLISACMRATSQIRSLTGMLEENDRRLIAARAILGEWLAGSGGGWQDSGGVWPGMKLIGGEEAAPGDPEHGISRGRLLPSHKIFGNDEIKPETRERLQASLVLVHGGMAQDVGPILEMVTEKYLLRSEAEWLARKEAIRILDEVVELLYKGDIRGIGNATHRNFDGPIQSIIPWAGNFYTDALIRQAREEMQDGFWGFWMLGGMSGGGMGFLFDPAVKPRAQERIGEIMRATKRRMEHAVPFAMDPVVYDFAINERGSHAQLLEGGEALMTPAYYTLMVPGMLRTEPRLLSPARRAELDRFAHSCRTDPRLGGMVQSLFDHIMPRSREEGGGKTKTLESLLEEFGFDHVQHEQIRGDMRGGRIGLAQNRLPSSSHIVDVRPGDVRDATVAPAERHRKLGLEALARGETAVVSLAGGVGSRWTHGAGVVKALHPFCKLGGKHRTFVEVHLAKSRRVGRQCGSPLPHVITTSYLTHGAIENWLRQEENYGYEGPLHLSPGRFVGLRLVPMARDLRFAWEEMPQQLLDEQKQKVQDSLRAALIHWAQEAGEASDYTDNLPMQCLHPVGHWYEVPNLLRNGVLQLLLAEHPRLRTLMVHNIDTLGASADPALLGLHLDSGAAMTFEVIQRRIDDRGGGLARVDGRTRLVEGLALPSEEIEFGLTYYNSSTTWVDVERLLEIFGLSRAHLEDEEKVTAAIRRVAARMPAYITLKDVKKRWGKGQEDIFPVAQFEKLWGDMTALEEADCRFVAVPRLRGQQLKEVAQLDGWLRDGSATYVEALCDWE